MTSKHDCSETVADRELRGMIYPCQRNATVEHDGKWYCWQHDPERMKAEAKKCRAGWEAKMDREVAKYKRIARNAKLAALVTPKLAALLERLVQNTEILVESDMSPNSIRLQQWRREVKRGYTLAACIREALEETG